MPWKPRVSRDQVATAVSGAPSWAAVLRALGYAYHGKNITTIRKWAELWGISTEHLSDHRDVPPLRRRYSEEDLRRAVAASYSWAETLRRLGYCPTGGNWKTLKKRVAEFEISTAHFDPYRATRGAGRQRRRRLSEILIEGSTFSRSVLKERLYDAGLKERKCELCGQDEIWNGRRIGLILDHINGIRNDNRLENLRIICPNCAAGLDTHCGRKNRLAVEPRSCARCGTPFQPKYARHRYCSVSCGRRSRPRPAVPKPNGRKVDRPPYDQLIDEVKRFGYLATGRKYGVSDNAIRKWIRQYERERAVAEGRDPDVIEIPTRTWPNQKRRDEAA
jgi:transposase-like protein